MLSAESNLSLELTTDGDELLNLNPRHHYGSRRLAYHQKCEKKRKRLQTAL